MQNLRVKHAVHPDLGESLDFGFDQRPSVVQVEQPECEHAVYADAYAEEESQPPKVRKTLKPPQRCEQYDDLDACCEDVLCEHEGDEPPGCLFCPRREKAHRDNYSILDSLGIFIFKHLQ